MSAVFCYWGLLLLLMLRCVMNAMTAKDDLGKFLCFGFFSMLAAQNGHQCWNVFGLTPCHRHHPSLLQFRRFFCCLSLSRRWYCGKRFTCTGKILKKIWISAICILTMQLTDVCLRGKIKNSRLNHRIRRLFLLVPLGLRKPLVLPGVNKKALANKTSVLQSRWFGNRITKEQGGFTQMKNEVKHTAHSSYRCEYHVVFAPESTAER